MEDHCEAIMAIINRGKVGESYNIGGNFELSNLNLAQLICNKMNEFKPMKKNYCALISFIEDRQGGRKRRCASR